MQKWAFLPACVDFLSSILNFYDLTDRYIIKWKLTLFITWDSAWTGISMLHLLLTLAYWEIWKYLPNHQRGLRVVGILSTWGLCPYSVVLWNFENWQFVYSINGNSTSRAEIPRVCIISQGIYIYIIRLLFNDKVCQIMYKEGRFEC